MKHTFTNNQIHGIAFLLKTECVKEWLFPEDNFFGNVEFEYIQQWVFRSLQELPTKSHQESWIREYIPSAKFQPSSIEYCGKCFEEFSKDKKTWGEIYDAMDIMTVNTPHFLSSEAKAAQNLGLLKVFKQL